MIPRTISRIGFGTANLQYGFQPHLDVLTRSLLEGINVIDTARNYQHGDSEELIGDALKNVIQKYGKKRSDIFIISKAGYVDASELNVIEQNGTQQTDQHSPDSKDQKKSARLKTTHELIDLSDLGGDEPFYSLSPELLSQQISVSLQSIDTDYIDCYMLHCPERYVHYVQTMSSLYSSKEYTDRKEAEIKLKELNQFPSISEKLFDAFVELEKAVKDGQIKSYGVSSNWLSYSKEADLLHYKEWREISRKAYSTVNPGNTEITSNLKALQFPGNLLEMEGIDQTAPWAKQNGYLVFINRPLNAITSKGIARLATYRGIPNSEYQSLFARTLERFPITDEKDPNHKHYKFLHALVTDLDREKFNYDSLLHFQHDYERQLIPMITERFRLFPNPLLLSHLQEYLVALDGKIREFTSTSIEDSIQSIPRFKNEYNSRKEDLQHFAIRKVLESPNVDCMLLGMRRMIYLEEALEILNSSSMKNGL